MFWPTKHVGWFFEPSYGYGVGKSRGDRSAALLEFCSAGDLSRDAQAA
jgi:hypothetical protein